jgi:hypothetical protein
MLYEERVIQALIALVEKGENEFIELEEKSDCYHDLLTGIICFIGHEKGRDDIERIAKSAFSDPLQTKKMLQIIDDYVDP